MSSPTAALASLTRARALRLFLILVTVVSAWLTYTKLRLSNDLTDLFPNRGEAAMLTRYLRGFGGGDLAVVLLQGDDPAEIEAAAKDLATDLKTKKTVERVLDEAPPPRSIDPTLTWAYAGPRARERLAHALTPEGMRSRLADTRDLLLAPGSAEAETWLEKDPLRLAAIPWEDRTELAAGVSTSSGGFFTANGGHARLVVAQPKGSAFDGDAAEAFVDDANASMDATRAKHPGVTTALTGGHAIARATASLLQRDMILSGTLSTVFASLTFFLTFRRGRALIAVLPPLGLGTLWTTGIAAFFPGGLSAIATAFAAVVIGVGVDTGVHVYAALLDGRRRGLSPDQAAAFARSATWKPTLLAAVAAGLAFMSLAASELAAVRQLGLLCGAGEVLTAVGILLVTPSIGALLEKGEPPSSTPPFWIAIIRNLTSTRKRSLAILGIAVAPIVVLTILGWPQPSETLVAIRPKALAPLQVQREIYKLFGSKEGQWIVVSASKDREDALAHGDKVAEALDRLTQKKIIDGYDALTSFAPSPALQRKRLDERDALDLPKKRGDLESALSEAGFDLQACAPALDAFSHPSEDTHPVDSSGPLEWLISRHVAEDRGETLVVSYVRPNGDPKIDRQAVDQIHAADPTAVVTGYQHLETALRESLAHDLPIVGLIALVLTVITLRTILKRGTDVALSLATIVIEVAAVALLMRVLHVRWHVYDALVLPVLIGITMDESMFLLHAARSGENTGESLDHAIGRALEEQGALVVATGLTTSAGFAALLVCKFEGLFDLGAVGALGSTLGLLSALFVVPAGLRALEKNLEASMTERIPSELLEPLEPILPPEGVVAVKLADIASRAIVPGHGRVDVAGVRGSGAAATVAAIARASTRQVVIVTSDLEAARKLTEDIGFFLRGALDEEATEETGIGEVLLFTANESSPYAEVNPDRRAGMSRMATLFHLAELPWRVLVVPATALARKTVPRDVVVKNTWHVAAEEALDRDTLIHSLSETGYLRVPLVEDPGSFAVRGSLVDVWPPNRELPVRIELYGELVVSIHEFDPHEQRTRAQEGASGEPEIWLPPAREAILDKQNSNRARDSLSDLADAIDLPTLRARALIDDVVSGRAFFGADGYLPAYYKHLDSLFSYLAADAIVVLDEPAVVANNVREDFERATKDVERKEKEPIFPRDSFFVSEAEVARELDSRRVVALHRTPVIGSPGEALAKYETATDALDLASRGHEDLARAVKGARTTQGKTATLSPLVRRIHHFRAHGLNVFIAARAHTQAERLTALLRHQGVPCRARLEKFNPAWLAQRSEETSVVVGPLTQGVVLPADGIVIVTEEEVFGARSHRRRERKAAADPARPFLEDLRSLTVGDYVVHGEHGVGKYLGLIHKQVGELTVDLICVEYAANDKLYLPVYRLNQIQKYSGGENAQPKLDRLGGSTFAKTKSKVKKAVRQMADELLRLYAERQAQPGHALGEIDEDYRAFEATFAFDETPDQQRAIAEVNKDLGTDKPMDRLVCGDVGFGKTEVALRAAFRVATSGKQVALLCPTTVLAQQHLRTFETRMQGYPIVVRALSRFQTKKEIDETIAQLKEGKVDVVIGTHRLLSKDVHFKDLGLLVVDEEQRFGVTHKERIKQIRAQVDVLTLTATPIPRTLQMAVGGLRDLSLITTPPIDRRAVRTIVTRFDDEVIREACERELSRGGQIFYVYNRVEGLYERAQKLQQLIPRARVAVAHGQMSEVALEEVMLDFVEGRYDVLCATAIIESGLDIPRANTMVIDRADLFGLAQLYQLRGRVGRSKERAYCYLIVPANNALSDEARSRIEALERHTELGSGFQIASLDLELRGAGDLLGGEQSGNVASVGFDLFCHMLEEAVQELRGEPAVHDVDPDLSFDVSALLPDDYINEVGVRLSLYKRLASAMDEAHVQDIAVEMEDRFGPPPNEAKNLIELMRVKTELRRLMVLGCEANARSVTLHLREDTPLDPQKILELVRAPKSPYRLTPDMRLTRRFDGSGSGLSNAEELLAALAKCLKAA